MSVLTVRPSGNKLFAGWLDRRNDPTNSLIDVYGRWGTIATDGAVSFSNTVFRVSTTNFPPAYPGSLVITTNNGYYDPVWPPGHEQSTPERWVNLNWWYSWFPKPPTNQNDWEVGWNATHGTYCHETGEHNGAYADMNYVYFVWSDNRSESQATTYPGRRQADIRLARLPWPQ